MDYLIIEGENLKPGTYHEEIIEIKVEKRASYVIAYGFTAALIVYSIFSLICHLTLGAVFTAEYGRLSSEQKMRTTFRAVRIICGIEGLICLMYVLVANHDFGPTGGSWRTQFIFASYLGYLVFEVFMLTLTYGSVMQLFVKPSLLLMMLHHAIAGGLVYCMLENPAPVGCHYIGMIMLGLETVVISYSIVNIATKLGYSDSRFVRFNAASLPFQYLARQVLLVYVGLYCWRYRDQFRQVMSAWAMTFAVMALTVFTVFLNPLWLWETIVDSRIASMENVRRTNSLEEECICEAEDENEQVEGDTKKND